MVIGWLLALVGHQGRCGLVSDPETDTETDVGLCRQDEFVTLQKGSKIGCVTAGPRAQGEVHGMDRRRAARGDRRSETRNTPMDYI